MVVVDREMVITRCCHKQVTSRDFSVNADDCIIIIFNAASFRIVPMTYIHLIMRIWLGIVWHDEINTKLCHERLTLQFTKLGPACVKPHYYVSKEHAYFHQGGCEIHMIPDTGMRKARSKMRKAISQE